MLYKKRFRHASTNGELTGKSVLDTKRTVLKKN